jgi:hypothetical protein
VYKHINPIQPTETMNISRLIPFLPLLLLLPATSSAALVFPSSNSSGLKPGDLCPLIQIVEHELCSEHLHHLHLHHNANNASDLCVLLHNFNTSFCSGENENFVTKPISYDVMSARVLEHEYNDHIPHEPHHDKDIHTVCPIINFIEQELCTSRNEEIKVHFDPKELCPLLNLTYTEICE